MVITGLTRNQVIPHGTEGSNPSLSASHQHRIISIKLDMMRFFFCKMLSSIVRSRQNGIHGAAFLVLKHI